MNELLDKITEFFSNSDNYEIIAAAGGIVLVLILLGIFISNRMKNRTSEKGREFFLEGEYDSMIREAAHAKKIVNQPASEIDREPEASMETEPLPAEELPVEDLQLEDLMGEDEFQPVHININIERGQVKIGYDEDGKVICMVESDEPDKPDAADEPVQAAAEQEGGKEELISQQDGIVLEKINLIKAAPVKKFGPDNFNTGRSGRIFTEEELQQQIKD